jgi:hypothetical protein
VTRQINLYNPAFKRQKKYFSAVAMVQSLLLVVLGIILFSFYATHQVAQLEKLSGETDQRLAVDQARLAEFQSQYSPQQEAQLQESELKKLEARASAQQTLVDTLKNGSIGNTQGYSEYMRAFSRQVVNGLWLTNFDLTGDAAQITLSGGVLSPELLPAYVQKLSQEKIMRGKSFSALQMQQPKAESGRPVHYIEFTLQSVDAGSEKPGDVKGNEMHGKAQ